MDFRGFPSCRELEIFVTVKTAVCRPKRNFRSKKRIPGGQKLLFDNNSVIIVIAGLCATLDLPISSVITMREFL